MTEGRCGAAHFFELFPESGIEPVGAGRESDGRSAGGHTDRLGLGDLVVGKADQEDHRESVRREVGQRAGRAIAPIPNGHRRKAGGGGGDADGGGEGQVGGCDECRRFGM
jgi:hypothetical protein